MNGEIEIKRYILRPESKKDAIEMQKEKGEKAVIPLDEYLKINKLPFKMTPELMVSVAMWGQSQSSYQEAEEAILRAHQIQINDDTIRAVTNYIGSIVYQEDCRVAHESYDRLNSGKLELPVDKKKGILYIEADGAHVNTRSKAEDGSSWRENKLGIVFSSDNIYTWTNAKGEKQRQINKREYVSYIGSAEQFKKHLFSCALKNGYGKYERTILISDGATWIRNMREELFPDAQQILDYYHLCENVNTFAKYLFGMEPSQYSTWANDICALLKASKFNKVLDDLKFIEQPSACPVDLYGYISNNIDNIDYANYIQNGFFIGSGAIESGNKSVLHQRLRQSGMRWNVNSAQYLLTLRSKYKSGLWSKEVHSLILSLF